MKKAMFANLLASFALLMATSSTTMSFIWALHEPKMPKSLIQRD